MNNNNYPSSTIHLCHYLAENYKVEFIAAASDSSLLFSSQMSAV